MIMGLQSRAPQGTCWAPGQVESAGALFQRATALQQLIDRNDVSLVWEHSFHSLTILMKEFAQVKRYIGRENRRGRTGCSEEHSR